MLRTLVLWVLACFAAEPPVQVVLSLDPLAAIPVSVEMTGALGTAEGKRLRLARTVVGSYAAANFAPHLKGLKAWNTDGEALQVQAHDHGGWVVRGHGELARIAYGIDTRAQEVLLANPSASSRVRADYAFLNGYGLYLFVEGAEEREHQLELRLPKGWRAASSLEALGDGSWLAHSAFELVDEPLMAGTAFRSAEVGPGRGVHLHVEGELDPDPLLASLVAGARSSDAALRALALPASQDRYHFFFEVLREQKGIDLGWAVERAHSMHGVDGQDALSRSALRTAYHLTHHELHAWMPRRLYTESLHPARMLKLAPSELIWFAEGFPQYLAFCGLAKAGQVPRELALRELALRFGSAYGKDAPPEPISLNELSSGLSIGSSEHWFHNFAGGALLALWIDLDMRRVDAEYGLLEAMRELGREFIDHPRGIPESDLVERLSRLTGLQLGPRFERHVLGQAALPVEAILAGAGIVPAEKDWRVLPDKECSADVLRYRDGAMR